MAALTESCHGHMIMTMSRRTIPAGRFKAECLALLDRVARTGDAYVVTKRGRPVAEVVPVRAPERPPLRHSVTLHGDIVGPILGEWNVDR
jgi:prevent-host-death family protein